MNVWYYIDNKNQKCAVSENEIQKLFGDGVLDKTTLIWTTGQLDWSMAKDVEKFSQYFIDTPPVPNLDCPTQKEVGLSSFTENKPRPWIRFFARTFDISFFTSVIYFLLIFTIPNIYLHVNIYLIGVIIVFIYIFFESFILSKWGTTLGKLLFNIRLHTNNGLIPNFSKSLNRNFKVWYRGYGLGIPLVTNIANIIAYFDLKKNGISSWDRDEKLVVSHGKVGILRIVILLFAFLFYLGMANIIFQELYPQFLAREISKNLEKKGDVAINQSDLKNNHDLYQENDAKSPDFKNNSENSINLKHDIEAESSNQVDKLYELFNQKKYNEIIREVKSGNYPRSNSNIIGLAYFQTNQYAPALKYFLEAEKIYPNDVIVKCNIGDTFLQLNKLSLSLAKYVEAYNIDNNHNTPISKINYIENFIDFERYGYTGEKVAFEFQKLKITSALEFFEQITGVDIVYNGDENITTTLKLNNVPVDLAFYVLLVLNNLEAKAKSNIIYVNSRTI